MSFVLKANAATRLAQRLFGASAAANAARHLLPRLLAASGAANAWQRLLQRFLWANATPLFTAWLAGGPPLVVWCAGTASKGGPWARVALLEEKYPPAIDTEDASSDMVRSCT